MSQIADLMAYGSDGQLALIVEVKGRTDRSRAWAAQFRQNLLAGGGWPNTPYLLIALPDRLYLWKDAGNTSELIEPTHEVDARPVFEPYFRGWSPAQLTAASFQIIVASCLRELVHFGVPRDLPEPQRQFFQNSGLIEAIKGGNVAVEVTA